MKLNNKQIKSWKKSIIKSDIKNIKSKIDRFYSRTLLGDAFQLKDVNIAEEAITMLEQNDLKPKIKDWMYFYGTKNKLLNKVIRLLK